MGFGGLLGGMAGSMLGGMLDGALGNDDANLSPVPSFIFEVAFYDTYVKAPTDTLFANNFGENVMGGLMGALPSSGLLNTPNYGGVEEMTNPGAHSWEKAFIEVSGLEMGIDLDTKQEGGNNFPLNLPGKMKNQNVILKRLVRPTIMEPLYDGENPINWNAWIEHSLKSMAYWNTPIKTKIVQINIMHPNLQDSSKPHILQSIDLYDAYPVKVSYGTLSSSSEDLLTQEIEIAFSNSFNKGGTY